MIKTEFEAVTDAFMQPKGDLLGAPSSVHLTRNARARLIYHSLEHPLPDGGEMQLSVFAVKEPGHKRVNAVHTIESTPEWDRPTYDRLTLDKIRIRSAEIILPRRMHLPELHVFCSMGGVMLLGWGKVLNGHVPNR